MTDPQIDPQRSHLIQKVFRHKILVWNWRLYNPRYFQIIMVRQSDTWQHTAETLDGTVVLKQLNLKIKAVSMSEIYKSTRDFAGVLVELWNLHEAARNQDQGAAWLRWKRYPRNFFRLVHLKITEKLRRKIIFQLPQLLCFMLTFQCVLQNQRSSTNSLLISAAGFPLVCKPPAENSRTSRVFEHRNSGTKLLSK